MHRTFFDDMLNEHRYSGREVSPAIAVKFSKFNRAGRTSEPVKTALEMARMGYLATGLIKDPNPTRGWRTGVALFEEAKRILRNVIRLYERESD